jgi:septal ring factor EnvC (AmiA/AmiB activator)
MKRALLTPLSILSIAVSASALTLDQPADTAAHRTQPGATPSAPQVLGGDVERQLADLDRQEAGAKQELESLAHDSEVLRARTLARGRAYTRLARAGLLPVGGGFPAFVEHAARLERLHRALSRDLDRERSTLQRRNALNKQLSVLTVRRGPLLAQQRALSEAHTALLAARDRDQAFERAFLGGAFDDHTAVYGGSPSGLAQAASGFAALKGSLPFPLSGRSEIRSARRASSGPGLEMRAPAGSAVRAVFPGRVAFADAYADYGRTVILDHGGGYYTVSANLGEVEVKVGDDVKGGARIATLSGGATGSRLYFEVRIGQETADPAEWFGI